MTHSLTHRHLHQSAAMFSVGAHISGRNRNSNSNNSNKSIKLKRSSSMLIGAEHLVELYHSPQSFDYEGRLLVRFDLVQSSLSSSPIKQNNNNNNNNCSNKQASICYEECLCRLRGNLLLIGHIEHSHSHHHHRINSPSNIADIVSQSSIFAIILNNFEIKLCSETATANGEKRAEQEQIEFCLILNKTNVNFIEKYYFICSSRRERDNWIENICLSSFNFLLSFKRSLDDDFIREYLNRSHRIESCNNNQNQHQSQSIISTTIATKSSPDSSPSTSRFPVSNLPESNCFILVKCDNLRLTRAFDAFVCVKVFIRRRFIDHRWQPIGSTEIIQSPSPRFVRAIDLPEYPVPLFELKFELIRVIERQFDTAHLVAFAYHTFKRTTKLYDPHYYYYSNLRRCSSLSRSSFRIPLIAIHTPESIGTLSFAVNCAKLYRSTTSTSSLSKLIRRSRSVDDHHHRIRFLQKSVASSSSWFGKPKQREIIRRTNSTATLTMNTPKESPPLVIGDPIFGAPITRKFAFKPLPHCGEMIIEESMSDTKYVFLIPQILLKLYSHEEEKIVTMSEQFYRQNSTQIGLVNVVKPFIGMQNRTLATIKDSLSQIAQFMSTNSFRPSARKHEIYLQFIPINFHRQICRAFDTSGNRAPAIISMFSTGAYACHHLGYDRAGMKSLLTARTENRHVTDCWTLLKKLHIVLRCESRIGTLLTQMQTYRGYDDEDDDDAQLLPLAAIESTYKEICALTDTLIDLVSVSDADELLRLLNDRLSTISDTIKLFDDHDHDHRQLDASSADDCDGQLEPIELVYLNLKACSVAIAYKLSQTQINRLEIDSCNRKLRSAIESLRKIVFACSLSAFARLTTNGGGDQSIESLYSLRFRYLSIYTQALTTLSICIMDHIHRRNDFALLRTAYRTRYILLQHESLLSCYGDEFGMLEDISYALEELNGTVSVLFTLLDSSSPCHSQIPIPDIEFFGDKIRLHFRIRSTMPKRSNDELANVSQFECKIISLIFNIGINEQATLAYQLNLNSFQRDLNEINFHKLKAYITQFYGQNSKMLTLIGQLKRELSRNSLSKNIRILQLARQTVREADGICVTCCKSGKDRTGMSVTLEEVRFFCDHFKLDEETHSHLFQTILDTLRRDGTRLENTYKNIGARKYAFNRLQLVTFPKLFRPPSGTYSMLET